MAVLATVAGLVAAVPFVTTADAAQPVVVSLTFDDGNADQMTGVNLLKQYGFKGTFYIISGSVGAPNYVTRADLATIAANGNEIGGHTVSHPDLTTVPADEVARQVCNDRVTLSNWGYAVRSFAYPYAAYNASVEQAVANCGYNSARTLGDIASAHGCTGCDAAGPIPPADPYNLPAVDQFDKTWTLAQMKAVVTKAETVGGWVPFTFHHICSGTGCDSLSVSPTVMSQFLAWLKTRPATTTVKTVGDVVGGAVKPLVNGPPAGGSAAVVNPSLETAGTGSFPQCWFGGGYGTNTATFARTTDAHTGSFAEKLTVTGYASGDAKLLPTFDLGSCSPTIAAGKTYTLGAWYKSSTVTQFTMYYRDAAGGWFYWTSGPWLGAASTWTQASWTTPAAPPGATGISFGLNLFGNGTLTTDDYSITEGAVAQAAPTAQPAPATGAAGPPGARSAAPTVSSTTIARTSASPRPETAVPGARVLRPGARIVVPAPAD